MQRFARLIFGYPTDDKESKQIKNRRLPPDNSILALHVIQLFAEKLGMPRHAVAHYRRDLPQLRGKNFDVSSFIIALFNHFITLPLIQLLSKLADWPSVITAAHDLSSKHVFGPFDQSTGNSMADAHEDVHQRLKEALWDNLASSFRKDKLQIILCNFRLVAFMLGWYFQVGVFATYRI